MHGIPFTLTTGRADLVRLPPGGRLEMGLPVCQASVMHLLLTGGYQPVSVLTIDTSPPPVNTRCVMNMLDAECEMRGWRSQTVGNRGGGGTSKSCLKEIL